MQYKYTLLQKIEVELKQLEEAVAIPSRPCKSRRGKRVAMKHFFNYDWLIGVKLIRLRICAVIEA